MNTKPNQIFDVAIIGAGPVGLMCAYLGQLSGLSTVVIDKSDGPLQVGRADALNARTLQLLEVVDLFKDLFPIGKPCNTSSVWANGKFISRQSKWWDALEGTFHKHFLMIGQAYVEKLLDAKLKERHSPVKRNAEVQSVELIADGVLTTLKNGETIRSRFAVGADGSRSLVREQFNIPFEVTRPQIVWAVIDGIIDTDFPKVPEIIVFQTDTSDVAWIPREEPIDRFYIRMDTKEFTLDEAIARINRAMAPHSLRFKEIAWFSHFSVKESVAESFCVADRVFLVGDASHIHSVNGGMGLNTGLGDAFNLMWKINMVLKGRASSALLQTYEAERKPVAMSIVQTSGELVRSTKYSKEGTHAEDYVDIVEKRAGNVTGMGIRYQGEGLVGTRLHDFEITDCGIKRRIYSLLDYAKYTLLIFDDTDVSQVIDLPDHVQVVRIPKGEGGPYQKQALLVRPDSYIAATAMSYTSIKNHI